MFEHIMTPLDGSRLAEIVLPHLVLLAHINHARITVVRVLDADSSQTGVRPVDPFEWQLQKAEAETYLQGVTQRLQAVDVEAESLVLEGRSAESILDYAHEQQVDLILLSSHGQSGLSGWNVSSVVQKIILRARTSVMIVRAYTSSAPDLDGLRYAKILLPLDGSARAEVAIPVAAALARDTQAILIAAHVVQKPAMPRRIPLSAEEIELSNAIVERNRVEAERYLEELATRLGVAAETRLMIEEAPIAALHRLAEQEEAGLVVLSAHGYSGETRWPFGSVVVSFIAYGTTPLIVIQDMPSERIEPTMAEIVSRERGGH